MKKVTGLQLCEITEQYVTVKLQYPHKLEFVLVVVKQIQK